MVKRSSGRYSRRPDVRLHVGWAPFLLLLTTLLATQHLADAHPQWPALTDWLVGLFVSLLCLATVLIHEVAHVLAAAHYRLPIRRITIYPFGGVRQGGLTASPPVAMAIVAFAGPLASLLLAGLAGLGWHLGAGPISGWIALFSLGLAIFNLIPAAPLDGALLLAVWAQLRQQESELVDRITFFANSLIGVGLMLSGGFAVLISFLTDDVWLVFIDGCLVLLVGWLLQTAADQQPLLLDPRHLPRLYGLSLAPLVEAADAAPRGPVAGPLVWLPLIMTHERWSRTAAKPGVAQSLLPWVVYPHTPLLHALERLDELDATVLFVVQNGRITTVLTRAQLLRYVEAWLAGQTQTPGYQEERY